MSTTSDSYEFLFLRVLYPCISPIYLLRMYMEKTKCHCRSYFNYGLSCLTDILVCEVSSANDSFYGMEM